MSRATRMLLGLWGALVCEKELSLGDDSAALKVLLRVRNAAAEARQFQLRAQNCLPPTPGVST